MAFTRAQPMEMPAKQNGLARGKSIQTVGNLVEVIKRTLESGWNAPARFSATGT